MRILCQEGVEPIESALVWESYREHDLVLAILLAIATDSHSRQVHRKKLEMVLQNNPNKQIGVRAYYLL